MSAVNHNVPVAAIKITAPPTTRKTSLYRLRTTDPSAHRPPLVRPPPLPGPRRYPGPQGRPRGPLWPPRHWHDRPRSADWCDPLSALSGHPVAEENQTTLALLLVRTGQAIYGLAYSMGHQMLNPARIDPGFGIELAIRCLDADRITKVRRQVMDARGRTDENPATGGENIRGFGIEQFGKIVSQIAGQISNVPLTFTKDRSRRAHITGNDRSVKLPLGSTPASLLHDLRRIEEVCALPSPLSKFEFIDQVRPPPEV